GRGSACVSAGGGGAGAAARAPPPAPGGGGGGGDDRGISRSRRPRSAAPRPGGFRSWLGHGRFGLVRLLVRRLAHGGRHLLLRRPLAQEPDRQRGQRTERGAEEEAERPVELRRAVQG